MSLEKLKKLSEKSRELTEELRELENRKRQLEEELREKERKLQEVISAYNQFLKKLQREETELQKTTSTCNSLLKELQNLKSQKQEYQNYVQKLQEHLRELRSQQEELESQVSRLKFQRDQYSTEITTLKNQVKALKQERKNSDLSTEEPKECSKGWKAPLTLSVLLTLSLIGNGLLYTAERNSRMELQSLMQSLTEAQKQLNLYRRKGLTPEAVKNWEIYTDSRNNPYCLHVLRTYPVYYNIRGKWKYLTRHYEMCIPLSLKQKS